MLVNLPMLTVAGCYWWSPLIARQVRSKLDRWYCDDGARLGNIERPSNKVNRACYCNRDCFRSVRKWLEEGRVRTGK